MSVYTNDIDTLRQMLSQSIPQIINSVITMAATLVTMLVLNPALTLISLATAFVMLRVTASFSRLSARYYVRQQMDLGAVDGFIEEMLDGQKVVKVFCHEEAAKKDFHAVNEKLRESADKANTYANLLMPVNANIGWISYALVAIVGAVLGINQLAGVTIGTVVTFVGLNKSFTNPITQVSQQVNFVVNAAAGAQRVFDLMDQTPEADDGYVELVNARENEKGELTESPVRTNLWAWKHPHRAEGTVTYQKLEGGVVMDDVDFGYNEDKIVLHNITLFAEPGQKIAFVGATGAGKTTITNLINRFYDIADGKIRYDGININKIKKGDLRRSLGMVLQDTHLFTGTVMENIRYGKMDATDEECIKAAQLANADGFIRRLPEGYQTMLTGDGSNLSQGQRQLLAIARAAVADPPALILDEATSSIDTRTEKLVQAGMDALMKGTDHLCHCPSAFHSQERGLHHGHGAGPHHRAGHPRPAHRCQRQILSAVYRQFCGLSSLSGMKEFHHGAEFRGDPLVPVIEQLLPEPDFQPGRVQADQSSPGHALFCYIIGKIGDGRSVFQKTADKVGIPHLQTGRKLQGTGGQLLIQIPAVAHVFFRKDHGGFQDLPGGELLPAGQRMIRGGKKVAAGRGFPGNHVIPVINVLIQGVDQIHLVLIQKAEHFFRAGSCDLQGNLREL